MKLQVICLAVLPLACGSDTPDDLSGMQARPVLASSNLLDSDDFFVCGSQVPGMNGHYVLQDPDVVQSDPDTPVFFREDDEDSDAATAVTDFRLFRHNGFWMIADVEPWPPVTHFRCDPTKSHVVGTNIRDICGLGQSTPPRTGYTAANEGYTVRHIALHRSSCQERVAVIETTSNNASTRKDEL